MLVTLSWLGTAALAGQVHIAVASNFRGALEALSPSFQEQTNHEIVISSGATGLLYAQIVRGAPFDVFLSADLERPSDLGTEGFAIGESLSVYARGQLAIVLAKSATHVRSLSELGTLGRIAIANPRTAPYGRAAEQVLAASGLVLDGKLAQMQNVGGVIAAVHSGAADAGITARSALSGAGETLEWLPVPTDLHDPIEQGAVLLVQGRENPAARAFLAYLASADAKTKIKAFGYNVD